MKTHKIYKIMLMALMLFTASLFITGVDAEAKAYKAKNVKVTSGKTKTVKTKKKIKKVKIVSKNKNFTVKKTGNYKFKVSGTDKGKTQTVKVTYTNKYTQKFKIKTVKAKKKTTKKIPSYAQKIVNELKPLLADPDKGLDTVQRQWEKRKGYELTLKVKNQSENFTTGEIKTISTIDSMDEIKKVYTVSQKKALILEIYFRQRMQYTLAGHNRKESYHYNRNSNAFFKLLYQGKFWGYCGEGAEMAYDICQYLGIKSALIGSTTELNHGWCGIWVTDRNGTSYWHGIYTTANGVNMKSNTPISKKFNLTRKQIETYRCNPNHITQIVAFKKINKPEPTAQPSVTTQTPVQTPVPQATPAPTPKPSPTTTTVIFNTPEPPEPEETETPVATTEPTKAPVVTQEPSVTTQAPIVTPEPTPEPTPAPTETPVPQRIVIPHDEHGYTCPGCNVAPYRHKSKTNPYISNFTKVYGDYTVYEHNCNGTIRYFDADGNEYIDINRNSDIMDEIVTLAR